MKLGTMTIYRLIRFTVPLEVGAVTAVPGENHAEMPVAAGDIEVDVFDVPADEGKILVALLGREA